MYILSYKGTKFVFLCPLNVLSFYKCHSDVSNPLEVFNTEKVKIIK